MLVRINLSGTVPGFRLWGQYGGKGTWGNGMPKL
jgi:hypothetical protein